jgi:asparagine synthase (glutamine-hydrolysing)
VCGIAGWIDTQIDLTKERPVLERMMTCLKHRGPDASGMWLSSRAGLAHRRLVVVDPLGGQQPMIYEHGGRTYILVYNGELYNTDELRKQLQGLGHTFNSHSDTEVLLKAYAQWERECVRHLNGIFAFAVWNLKDQTLFMARDRLGVKPLFYTQRGSAFLFASEIKALLVHPLVPAHIDQEGLAEIFALGPARTPGHGVFKGINELKPAEWLIYDSKGIRRGKYWSLISSKHTDDYRTTLEKVKYLFTDAVKRQLVSDVPVCTLLSGGLDSSAITAVASSEYGQRGERLNTYSVDYLENDLYFRSDDFQPDSDLPWAKDVASVLGTKHHTVWLNSGDLHRMLDQAMQSKDLPGMADIDTSLYLFSRQIRQDATVALSGECADEVFSGYPWFRREDALQAKTFPWSLKTDLRKRILSKEVTGRIDIDNYIDRRYREALSEVPVLEGETGPAARQREITYLTLTRWMPTLLERKDRMSMAEGLEIRVPFCDHRLVEYVWNVPMDIKFAGGREKGLLRTALRGILPERVLWRPKSPYPKTHNPSYLSATVETLKRILKDLTSPLRPLLNKDAVKELINSGASLDKPWFGQLMRAPQLFGYLIQVDLWMRRYKVVVV